MYSQGQGMLRLAFETCPARGQGRVAVVCFCNCRQSSAQLRAKRAVLCAELRAGGGKFAAGGQWGRP
eukprot:3596698-Lingulodinium_polyedra.AAC.1